ncbi:hypothetical protein D3C81_1998100 [compost metagenome]
MIGITDEEYVAATTGRLAKVTGSPEPSSVVIVGCRMAAPIAAPIYILLPSLRAALTARMIGRK